MLHWFCVRLKDHLIRGEAGPRTNVNTSAVMRRQAFAILDDIMNHLGSSTSTSLLRSCWRCHARHLVSAFEFQKKSAFKKVHSQPTPDPC